MTSTNSENLKSVPLYDTSQQENTFIFVII